MPNRPFFPIYPGDELRGPVAGCSLAAQGLWLRMRFIMHDSERRGYLHQNGSAIPPESVARRCGCTPEQYETLLAELDQAGVPSRTTDGVIYDPAMVAEERKRSLCAEAGKRGGSPILKGLSKGAAKGEPSPQDKPKPTPSVSSSVSKEDKTLPATPVGRLQALFADGLRAHPRGGPEARVNLGLLGRIVKGRLAEIPEEDLAARVHAWFASTDAFILENINNVGIFDNRLHLLKGGPIHGRNPDRRGAGSNGDNSAYDKLTQR